MTRDTWLSQRSCGAPSYRFRILGRTCATPLAESKPLINTPPSGEWIDTLPDTQKQNAERLLGLIRGVELDDEKDRAQLFKSGMLAFERLRLREQADLLTWKPSVNSLCAFAIVVRLILP